MEASCPLGAREFTSRGLLGRRCYSLYSAKADREQRACFERRDSGGSDVDTSVHDHEAMRIVDDSEIGVGKGTGIGVEVESEPSFASSSSTSPLPSSPTSSP